MHEEDIKPIWKDSPSQRDLTGLASANNVSAKDTDLIKELLYLVESWYRGCRSEDYWWDIGNAVEKANKRLEEV